MYTMINKTTFALHHSQMVTNEDTPAINSMYIKIIIAVKFTFHELYITLLGSNLLGITPTDFNAKEGVQ